MYFTCMPCGKRSGHAVSKQGYHYGSVLVTCPQCKNRHVVSDHLGIFGDRKITIEDLMREKGRLVKKGRLTANEPLEFWQDTRPAKSQASEDGAVVDAEGGNPSPIGATRETAVTEGKPPEMMGEGTTGASSEQK